MDGHEIDLLAGLLLLDFLGLLVLHIVIERQIRDSGAFEEIGHSFDAALELFSYYRRQERYLAKRDLFLTLQLCKRLNYELVVIPLRLDHKLHVY